MILYMVRKASIYSTRDAGIAIIPVSYYDENIRDNYTKWVDNEQLIIKSRLYKNKLTRMIYENLHSKPVNRIYYKLEKVEYLVPKRILNFNRDLSIFYSSGGSPWHFASIGDFIFDNKKNAIKLCHLIIYNRFNTSSKTVMDYIFK